MNNCIISKFDKAMLEQKHTKQLLKMRGGGSYKWIEASGYCGESCKYADVCNSNKDYNKKLVREILATREHIPNKAESKARRKEEIKRHEKIYC